MSKEKICEIPFRDLKSPFKRLNEFVGKHRLTEEGFDLAEPITFYVDEIKKSYVFRQASKRKE